IVIFTCLIHLLYFFLFSDTTLSEFSSLSLHDALPISQLLRAAGVDRYGCGATAWPRSRRPPCCPLHELVRLCRTDLRGREDPTELRPRHVELRQRASRRGCTDGSKAVRPRCQVHCSRQMERESCCIGGPDR